MPQREKAPNDVSPRRGVSNSSQKSTQSTQKEKINKDLMGRQNPGFIEQKSKRSETRQTAFESLLRTHFHHVDHDTLLNVRIEPTKVTFLETLLVVVTYFLVCTDVLRTRVVSTFDGVEVKPEMYQSFGPYAYPVVTISKVLENNSYSSSKDVRVWSYKYDTVSRGMRGILHHDGSDIFPSCVMYKSKCPGTTLGLDTGFIMLDNLVSHISKREYTGWHQKLKGRKRQSRFKFEGVVSANYVDYVSDYLLHHFSRYRTKYMYVKAWYFDGEITRENSSTSICDPEYEMPDACTSVWSNYQQITSPTHKLHGVGDQMAHTEKRLREIQKQFPNNSVDSVVVEVVGYEDITFGAISRVSLIVLDTVSIHRVRNCSTKPCETIQVGDFRYEGSFRISDINSWTSIVKTLRYSAQVYYYLRLIGLILGIYYSEIENENGHLPKSVSGRWKLTLRILFHIPSQVVVYSAFVPIFLYATAHIIDSCATYAVSNAKLSTLGGGEISNFVEVFEAISMNMRNLWIYASLTIITVWAKTPQHWHHQAGVQGVVGHLVAFISCFSLTMGYRSVSLRDTNVVHTMEMQFKGTFALPPKKPAQPP